MERGCSRSFGVKDALDLEDVLRKGKRVKNECRQEGQESGRRGRKECGCWGAARIPLPLLPCFRVMRDRARSSGSGGWSLEGENPTAQHEVHRQHPWSGRVGTNICVNGSHEARACWYRF